VHERVADVSDRSRSGLQEEELDRRGAALVAPAQEASHRAMGKALDHFGELWPHRALQGITLKTNEIGSACRDEVSLRIGGSVLEHTHHDVLIDEDARPLGAAAGELGDEPPDLIGQSGIKRAAGQALLWS
jgi:hypothetical protein